MKIEGLDFIIKKVDIQNGYSNKRIIIHTKASKSNSTFIINWFNKFNANNLALKKDLIFNTVQIYGLFPTEYDIISNEIFVTFSADYINGNLELFKNQQLRKAKIKNLNFLQ